MQMRMGEAGGGGEDEKGGGCHRGGADHSLSLARRKYHRDLQTDRSHLINAGRTVSPALRAAGSAARRPELSIIKTGWTKKKKDKTASLRSHNVKICAWGRRRGGQTSSRDVPSADRP